MCFNPSYIYRREIIIGNILDLKAYEKKCDVIKKLTEFDVKSDDYKLTNGHDKKAMVILTIKPSCSNKLYDELSRMGGEKQKSVEVKVDFIYYFYIE